MFCCALLTVHSSFAIILIAVEKTNDMSHKCTLLECDSILEDDNLYWSLLLFLSISLQQIIYVLSIYLQTSYTSFTLINLVPSINATVHHSVRMDLGQS